MNKFLSLSCFTILLVGCSTEAPPAPPTSDTGEPSAQQKIVVSTSFYPLTHFAMQVAGDLADVRQIASPGVDPHEYEPTPGKMEQIFESDIVIYNGQGQDPYVDRMRNELEQRGMRLLMATELVERMSYDHDDHDDEEYDDHEEHEEHDDHEEDEHDDHEDDEHHDHDHGEWDPHVWLDPLRAGGIVEAIAAELATIDPANAAQYKENAAAYVSQLQALDQEMLVGLSSCALDSVIVSHDAYRYLANRYGFRTHEIAGLSPSMEPSPARLAKLTEIASEEGIGHVFFETQVSPALSETLAQEIGAETLVLHSIEALTNQERSTGKTYIDLQRMNLDHLRTALQCS